MDPRQIHQAASDHPIQPAALTLEIREVEQSENGKGWGVALRSSWDPSGMPTLLRIDSPATRHQEATLQWFLEEFTDNPFDEGRADKARSYLQSYGDELHRVISSATQIPLSTQRDTLLIVIRSGTEPSQFQSLHWEVLEDPSRWLRCSNRSDADLRITVVRQAVTGFTDASFQLSSTKPLRLLLLSA